MEENLAGIRLKESNNVFEEHAFAHAALADDGGDLSLKNAEVGSLQNLEGSESLIDVFELDKRLVHP